MRRGLRLALGLILAALVWVGPLHAPPAQAQDSLRQVDETGALVPRQELGLVAPAANTPAETASLDYAAWERLAERAEKAAANRNIGSEALEVIRRQMVDWRSALWASKTPTLPASPRCAPRLPPWARPLPKVRPRWRRSRSVARF